MPVVAELLVVIVHVPLTILHCPEPTPAEFADIVVVVVLHSSWSAPAFATVGKASIVMVTSSFVDTQLPLLIVQRNVALAPAVNPVTVVVSLVGAVIVATPDCNVHTPVPIIAVLPDKVAVVKLHSV